ncbi:ankyrin repeat-containing domain protein [Pyrenochaeta sp. MPI-SDFR-AT-0127]|nr:ankyrin repeat-containing domain protein [Pyrenochaeta sp. MPI-SDFR-AT-0127]
MATFRMAIPINRPEELVQQMKQAILSGNKDSLRRNLDRFMRIGDEDQLWALNGRILLHIAAEEGQSTAVQVLLEARADPNARNSSGKTILHIAAASKSENASEIISSTIQHGGDVNARDLGHYTPLHYSVQNLAADSVSELIEGGADVNSRVPEVGTPLHFAVLAQGPSRNAIITRLLSAGADVNARNDGGMTPLHYLGRDDKPVARDLLEAGGDPNARDRDGKTPLHYAVGRGYRDLVDLLLEFRADPGAADDSGVTPELTAALFEEFHSIDQLFQAPRVTKKRATGPLLSPQTRPSPPDGQRKEVCENFHGVIRYFGATSEYSARAVPVFDMLYGDELSKHISGVNGDFRWFHLPATNILWVKHLVETICSVDGQQPEESRNEGNFGQETTREKKTTGNCSEIQEFIWQTFNETGQICRFRRAGFASSTCSRDTSGCSSTQNISEMASMTLPVVDVDYDEKTRKRLEEKSTVNCYDDVGSGEDPTTALQEQHTRTMIALRDAYGGPGSPLHSPRSLYASSYDFLEDRDLENRNSRQVLTRYLRGKQEKPPRPNSVTAVAVGPERRKYRSAASHTTMDQRQPALQGRGLSRRNHFSVSTGPASQAAAEKSHTGDEMIRVQMLQVPQLWLWKIDKSTIITAFPERWDILQSRTMLSAIQSKLQRTGTIDDVVKSIAETCLNFIIEDQFYVREGLGMTTIDVFAESIASVMTSLTRLS